MTYSINRPRNRIKLLHWQGDGFAIYYKRLEKGTFEMPEIKTDSASIELDAQKLLLIMEGISLLSVKKRRRYTHHYVDGAPMNTTHPRQERFICFSMKLAYENLVGTRALTGFIIERDFAILTLQQELAQPKRMIFGAKSERFVPSVPEEQTSLGLDVETMVAPPVVKQAISYTREKQNNNKVHTGRLPIPAHIERIIIEVAPDVDVTGLKSIGEEITEETGIQSREFLCKPI